MGERDSIQKVNLVEDNFNENDYKSVNLNDNMKYYNEAVLSAYRLLDKNTDMTGSSSYSLLFE
jgi:hypothetical protein